MSVASAESRETCRGLAGGQNPPDASSIAQDRVLIWPLTPALSSTDQRLARIVCVLIAAVGSSTIALLGRNLRPIVWTSIAIVSGVAALAALYAHFDAGQRCIVDDSGQPDTSVPMSRKSRRWAERDVDQSRDARGLRNRNQAGL